MRLRFQSTSGTYIMYSSSWVYLDCALLDTGKKVEVCWVLLYCFTLLSARVSEAPQCQPVSALVAINISSDIRLQFTTPVPTLYTRGLNFITEISTYQHININIYQYHNQKQWQIAGKWWRGWESIILQGEGKGKFE